MEIGNTQRFQQPIEFRDPIILREILGTLGKNSKVISRVLEVELHHNGERLVLQGSVDGIELGLHVLQQLYALYVEGNRLTPAEIEQTCLMLKSEPEVDILALSKEVIFVNR